MENTLSIDEVEALVVAAGGKDGDLLGVMERVGLPAVAALAVDELVFRCEPANVDDEIFVRVDLVHRDHTFTEVLSVQNGQPVRIARGDDAGTASARLEFRLPELLRLLYGRPRERHAGTHRTEVTHDGPWSSWPSVAAALSTIVHAVSSRPADLDRLAVRYGSDKFGAWHWFTPHYDRHFRHLKDDVVRVLEIGIGGYNHPGTGGGSLRMWKRYFTRGHVFGLDVYPKEGLDAPRLRTIIGDQSDREGLLEIAERYGPFDVVIDDGSHISDHVLTSFDVLFPHVRPGGYYVIEDLWTAYCPGFGGNADPASSGATSLGLVKGLVDRLHYEEHSDGKPAGYPDENTVGLHVYHNMAVIEKGINAEGGIPSWVPRSYDELIPSAPHLK
ncbi:class I SAM-dependent methyltransferase [Amycolatopsis sp. NPDC059021]|uniref:class I SAM-dependent methyltransferase n=1 Tax=Amycolatopsis sp. NPDC059021 TaxID=3346704 RepID=UPI00366C5370